MTENFLTFNHLTKKDYQKLNEQLMYVDTIDVLKWACQQFGDRLVYACSFGAEGIVLLDMFSKVMPDATILFLDTHFHFKETYNLIDTVKQKYPKLKIEMLQPDLTAKEQAEKYGDKLWEREPNRCCHIRKVQPLKQRLTNVDAWLSGLRREQSPTRAKTNFVNPDDKFESIKICPLIHWTWEEIWSYIDTLELPNNPLHEKGYPSIGCEYCTFRVSNGDDVRSGRWKGMNKTECGLHSKTKNKDKDHDGK